MSERPMLLYNDRAKAEMAKRVDNMFARISNQTKIWDELQSRMTDPEALYFSGFEIAADFVKVGDHVVTKYGDEGKVISVSHESQDIEIQDDDGKTVKISSDRISDLFYGGLDLAEESSMGDGYYGWE